jgi:orotidine-5'-phosphate decarboxylase
VGQTSFLGKLDAAVERNRTMLCVGLDPDPDRVPQHLSQGGNPTLAFLTEVVHATSDLVCAYKPNFAFYAALGPAGWVALRGVLASIPEHLPVILDCKVGDIGNTVACYARLAYEVLGVDAVTVNPLMGYDAVEPFLAYPGRCAFLLCLTSNPGSADVQRLSTDDGYVYEVLARKAVGWSDTGTCGLVVGATHPRELCLVRDIAGDLPFLIPGIGAQGGDAEAVVQNALDSRGSGIIVNASRSILYASGGRDFADAARREAEALRAQLEAARPTAPGAVSTAES